MKTISATSKKGQYFVNAYNRSRYESISECYGRYSCAKACAERDCKGWMQEENGHDFRIIGYNSMQFTAAWRTADGLRVETACNSYLVR